MTEKVTVTVNEGKVRGFKSKTTFSGAEFYSFLGVPYGQSTEGRARFKDPVKIKPWANVLDATTERDGCIQFSLQEKKITGSEDCLYNNIFTPKIPSKGDPLKAVIVNIHPGGFFHGSPDPWYYGAPDYIMHQDVVYVCIGYRLHILGFLNLDLKECSGNQCLKDVLLSLQWIQENISAFGGDPNNVTLMGSSSGSAIVHFLLLSPLSKGLFHRAILMGMYIFSPLIVALSQHISTAYELAYKMGYDDDKENPKKLLHFYKELEFIRLFTARPERFFHQTTLQVFPASPFMASPDPRENSPLPTTPDKLIKTMYRVPVIIGFCEREAAMALGILQIMKRSIEKSFHTSLTQNQWGWGANLTDDERAFIQKEVESFYLNGEPIEKAQQTTLCDIITDTALSDVYDSTINVIAAEHPVYVYNFKYDGRLCTMKGKVQRLLQMPLEGAFHAADYSYWCYSEEFAGKNMSMIHPKDRETIHKLTSLFTSFAKTGDPNYEGMEVTWKPSTPDQPHHLIIDETLEARDDLLNGERMQFWHDLKKKVKQSCK